MANTYAMATISEGYKWDKYVEKNSASDLANMKTVGDKNYTIFAKWVNDAGLMGCQGQAWCGTFQFSIDLKTHGKDNALKYWLMDKAHGGYVGYSCFATRDRFKAYGRFDKNPRIGDLVIFSQSHMGRIIWISSDKKTIKTIEGNTSGVAYDRDGGGTVWIGKTYAISDAKIQGFCHLAYPEDANEKDTQTNVQTIVNNVQTGGNEVLKMIPTLRKGSNGRIVKVLKSILHGLGWDTEAKNKGVISNLLVIDYAFDSDTEKVVEYFQKAKGLEPDKVVGILTWTKLILG